MNVKETTLDPSSIQRLIHFVHNLEQKLLTVRSTHEQLQQLMSIATKTHENIL
ncbi:unnamed protein product, partial [Adineta ricciae]